MDFQEFINGTGNYLQRCKELKLNVIRYKKLALIKTYRNNEYDYETYPWMRYCRGIVIDTETNKVLCVPPMKSEELAELDACVLPDVSDKEYSVLLDGTMINMFYYQGGDTINYYQGISAFYKLFWLDPSKFFSLILQDSNYEYYLDFSINQVGFPPKYMFKDSRTLLVIKLSTILSFPGLGGYIATSVLLANLTYKWIWKGFEFVATRYSTIQKLIAVSFLYLPSVVFWGSGIMKDTFSFAASCFALYGINQIFVEKKKMITTSIQILLAVYLIISIKAYILFALFPGGLVYLNFERISKIKSVFVKIFVLPLLSFSLILIAQSFFFNFSEEFGKYSADRILEEAVIQQQDLTREVYGSNSFNIGEFEPTLSGVLSKAHLAINAALFRPYIWEVGSPTMLFSGIENLAIILAIIYFLFSIGPINLFRYIFQDSFLIFCLSFTIILAFGIGLSTANFGALVRYKIPFLPYFTALFFIIYAYSKKQISLSDLHQ